MYRLLSLFIVVAAAAVAAEPGCTTVTCGIGTIEKNGECAPADVATGSAGCGSGTILVGDRCVSTVECDPATTMPVVGSDGTVTCKGTGTVLPCGTPLPCSMPSSGKQTICGQLYDTADGSEFRGAATGAQCTTVTTTGPCALRMDAYDAIAFANNPGSAAPLQTGGKYIDDCGRYRFTDVSQPSSPFIGLGFDDADASKMGPAGVTNAVGVALPANPDNYTRLEAFIAAKATTDMWTSTGGPAVSTGLYVPIFRTHKCDPTTGICNGDEFAVSSGVQIYKGGQAVPNNDYYFTDAGSGAHTTIDINQTSTGSNGTGLLTGASVADNLVWTGMGGITDTVNCKWESHAAASIPNIVTFQIYRPTNQIGKTCNQ